MNKKHHKSMRLSISSRDDKSQDRHRVENSAGGLVFKRTNNGVFFAMVKDSYGKWTFPKGHVKRGETNELAAEREVCEEIGLSNITLHQDLDCIDIWFRDRYVFKGRLIHKFIYYYLFEAPPGADLKKPKNKKFGEKIKDVDWVPAKELTRRSTYADMKPIVKKALMIVKNI